MISDTLTKAVQEIDRQLRETPDLYAAHVDRIVPIRDAMAHLAVTLGGGAQLEMTHAEAMRTKLKEIAHRAGGRVEDPPGDVQNTD